ncbi:MAG: bifunctional diaminohydroxyphosphoribosylaminopyrimidine deaminase/5-amino-6-(5-phosphoribosylamino)uracil reductase RibD [Verrucomicrobiota bacterium]
MSDLSHMRNALRLARRGYGETSPNPMVGSVLVKGGKVIGQGWHRRAGLPHAEIEAMRDAQSKTDNLKGATLYVTLEPCSTQGRTPPCTETIIAAGIKRVVIAATDPNPNHAGYGHELLERAGIEVFAMDDRKSNARQSGRAVASLANQRLTRSAGAYRKLAEESTRLNEAFNHWIIHRTPFVTIKSAMTLDGKIATASGESKWITGAKARAQGMKLRQGADAILVGVNTVIADDPSLTIRPFGKIEHRTVNSRNRIVRRIILDPRARTPLSAKILNDQFAAWTTIVVSERAGKKQVSELAKKSSVLLAPLAKWETGTPDAGTPRIKLRWLLEKLGTENVTSLMVEGGGETNATFLEAKVVQRIAFFYAPKILCGRDARKGVSGAGIERLDQKISLREVEWRKMDPDLFLTARVVEG